MSIEVKDLVSKVNEAAQEVKGYKKEVEEAKRMAKEASAEALDISTKFARQNTGVYGMYSGDQQQQAHDPELKSFFSKGTLPAETKDLSVTNDGQGVTVRSQWSSTIFDKIRESSPMRQVCGVMSAESNEIEVLIDRDEPNSAWIGELGDRVETDASYLTRQKIAVHEHYAYPMITLQMLEDSQFNAETWLQGKLVNRFSRQEANAFVVGDGAGKPRGILDYGTTPEDSFTWGADPDLYTIGAQYSGADGDISDADALFDLVDSLKASYLPGASFLMTRAMRNKIRKLKDTQDRYLLQPSLTAGVPDTLLGYPVALAEDMPNLAADVVGVLFGNFNQAYTIVDRVGVTVQRDSVTKPGWVKYYARRRTGGALTNPEAVKALVLGTQPA